MVETIIRHKEKDFLVGELERVLATDFLKVIVKIGNHLATNYAKSTMEQVVKAIKEFGLFLTKSTQISRIPQDLKAGIAPLYSKGDWVYFLNEFSHFLQKNHRDRQVRQNITCMNVWLKHMAGEMLCPAGLEVPNHQSLSNKKPKEKGSILKAKLSDKAEAQLEAASKALGAARPKVLSGLEEDDSNLATIAKGVFYDLIDQLNNVDGLSTENFLFLVEATLENRLKRIYFGAIDQFKSAIEKRQKGKQLIEKGLPYMAAINDWLTYSGNFNSKIAKPILAKVRELTDEQFEAGIHAWCVHFHAFPGLHPYEGQTGKGICIRYSNEIRKYRSSLDFSADSMIALQGASRDLLISAYIILTFQTCANAGSLQQLTTDSKKDINAALGVVDWVKNRAGYVLSKFGGREELGLMSIFEAVAEATENYRAFAIRADKSYLFLHAYAADAKAKGRGKEPHRFIVRPSGFWFNKQAKKMVRKINEGDWTATVKDIRASILLLHALRHGPESAQHKAQHKTSKTTVGYLTTPEMRLKHEEKIRAFQEWLQVLVTINIEDVTNKLSLAVDAYEEITEQIANSHFGGAQCSEPLAGHQPGSEVGKPCTQIMMCMTCEKRMNVFIASEENVAHLISWREALQDAFKSGKIDKNNVNWTLWSVFIDTMYERMAGSAKHKGLLADVKGRIAHNANPYHGVFAGSI